jgi:hypothetical protein
MKIVSCHSLFVGPKCGRAIPVRDHLRRDFLIQATLDAGVRQIEYHSAIREDGRIVAVDGLIVDGDDGRHVIDFADLRPASDPFGENLMNLGFAEDSTGIMTVTEADIRQEPRLSAARRVWDYRRMVVHIDDRAQVIDALVNEGPVPLRALDNLVATYRNVEHVVYAMACAGEIEIDLRSPLDHRTIVCLGMRSPSVRHIERYGT